MTKSILFFSIVTILYSFSLQSMEFSGQNTARTLTVTMPAKKNSKRIYYDAMDIVPTEKPLRMKSHSKDSCSCSETAQAGWGIITVGTKYILLRSLICAIDLISSDTPEDEKIKTE